MLFCAMRNGGIHNKTFPTSVSAKGDNMFSIGSRENIVKWMVSILRFH